MHNQILIGMMVNFLAPWATGLLITLDGVQLMLFEPKGTNWKRSVITGLNLEHGRWVKRTLPFPVAVYNRCYSDQRSFINKLEQIIGSDKVFNYVTVFNKWEIYKVLSRGGLSSHLPPTYRFRQNTITEVLDSEKNLVLKPCQGRQGKNIFLLRQSGFGKYQLFQFDRKPKMIFTDSTSLRASLDRITQKHRPYLLQREIPLAKLNNRVFDLRLLVQKNALGQWCVNGNLSRVAAPEVFITNICNRICFSEEVLEQAGINAQKMLDQLTKLSLLAAQLLEKHYGLLGELSVDFGLDGSGYPWIIEVNGKPDKRLFFSLRDRELIERVLVAPLEYACFLGNG